MLTRRLLLSCVFAACPIAASAASWTKLANIMPNNAGSTMLLLTDGTVMVQGGGARWFRLTPDITGSYVNGAWSATAPMSTPRLDFASQVLPNGQLWVAGGEYAGPGLPDYWIGSGEIYDPVSDSWSPIAPFPNQSDCFALNAFGGTLTRNSPVVTGILSTAGFQAGWMVTGNGIPANTTILSVDSSSQIHLSQNATAGGGQSLSFSVQLTGNTTKTSAIITGIPSTAGLQVGFDVSGPGIPSGATIKSIDSATQIHITSRSSAAGTGVTLTFGVEISPPSCLGDGPSILLPGGQILVGDIIDLTSYLYNIATNTWGSPATRVYDNAGEAGFVALSDGRVLVYDVGQTILQNAGYAEIYDPHTNTWSSISPADGTAHGVLPVLTDPFTSELGPNMRLQDGRILQLGGFGNSALYTPSTNTWAAGPTVQGTLNGLPFVFSPDDAGAAILPNGHVIFAADAGLGVTSTGNISSGSEIITHIPATTFLQVGWPVIADGVPEDAVISSVDSPTQIHISVAATATAAAETITYGGGYVNPTELFDFDPVANTIAPVSPALPDANLSSIGSYLIKMLALPTGQVLVQDGSNQLWVYTPDGSADPSLVPTVTSVVANGGGVYTLTGTQITGQSAGSSYGDESQSYENYPIVRMVSSSGNVYYAKTTNWSSVAVGSGSTPETVNFTLNPAMPAGVYSLIVSGAGLSSNPVAFSNVGTITIQTIPSGLQFTVDGGAAQTAPQTLSLSQGTHTIAVASTQTAPGTQNLFGSWSDSGAASHTITIGATPATYTATFQTQYQLTITPSPAAGGTVTPTSGQFYNAGTTVNIVATPVSPYLFTGWTGAVASASSASTSVTMSAPETVVATFGLAGFTINPTSVNVGASGGTGSVSVMSTLPASVWTAVSHDSFVTITSGTSGTGSGTVSYSVAANSTGAARTGRVTIAGETFTVSQSAGGLAFYRATPCRLVDTRAGQGFTGQFGPPSMTAQQSRTFTVPASGCNIPATAQAYSLNVTVAPGASLGYLSIWPAGQSQPVVSTLNSLNGAILANAAIVPAGANGAINVFVSDNTDVIIDINGYFAPPSGPSALAFYPVTPCRVADTRSAPGPFGGPSLAAGGSRSFTVPSSACGIPATAQSYSLNVTAVPPAPLIYMTAWPTGQTQPNVSTLNALQGQIAANAAIVPAGTNGAISLFVSNASNAIVDINGYFAAPGSPGALYFYPVTPCRVADTRNPAGTFGGPLLGAASSRSFPIPGSSCALSPAAQAYSLNMTVVPSGSLLYLSTWPAGQSQPVVSTLNDLQGQILANATIVPAGTGGGISVFVSGATHLIIDVNGYFGQ